MNIVFWRKLYLLDVAFGVLTVAILYGINPEWCVRTFLDIPTVTVDMSHMFRTIMGLYIGLAAFWVWAAFRPEHQPLAIMLSLFFSIGLLCGRAVSVSVDGAPSLIMWVYTVAELAMIPVGIWLLSKKA